MSYGDKTIDEEARVRLTKMYEVILDAKKRKLGPDLVRSYEGRLHMELWQSHACDEFTTTDGVKIKFVFRAGCRKGKETQLVQYLKARGLDHIASSKSKCTL